MFNSNFMITLVALFAIILTMFKTEIKESFTTNGDLALIPTNRGLARNGAFAAWGGDGIQQIPVGVNAISRGGVPIEQCNYKLGYDFTQSFPCGIDTTRNIQTAPPPRFQVVEPKLNHYKPVPTAMMASDSEHPITHAEDVVHSNFGQMQRDSSKKKTIKENYNDYAEATVPLPSDMCNVNMLGTESQPVIYDRVMYSNIRSRTRGQGDYIRGDLMIAPDNYKPGGGGHPQWFQVSAKPNRDLNPGCMEHLFGRGEELALGVAQADIDVASFGL
jgi:hypothetical protein